MALLRDVIDRALFPNREVHAIPVLDGAFSPNTKLDAARRLGGAIERPDDLAVGLNGELFVSSGRDILRCSGDSFQHREVFASASGLIGPIAVGSDGRVHAGVSGHGVLSFDVNGQAVAELDNVSGTPLKCPTAIAVGGDGALFVTDGSRDHAAQDWLPDLMGRLPPSGRLVGCDSRLGNGRVLADGLAWPSGVAVAPGGSELFVAEAWAHRLSSFPMGGGKARPIIKNFAGYPARIKADASGTGWWMAFFGMRTQLVEFVLRQREFCDAMMAKVPRELWIGPSLEGHFDYREPTQIGRIKKLGIQKPWAPPRSYGLVAQLDPKGEPVASWHSRVDGQVHGITAVVRAGKRVVAAAKGRNLLVDLHEPTAVTAAEPAALSA